MLPWNRGSSVQTSTRTLSFSKFMSDIRFGSNMSYTEKANNYLMVCGKFPIRIGLALSVQALSF